MRIIVVSLSLMLTATAGLAQDAESPRPKVDDSSPAQVPVMQFIQEKISSVGKVSFTADYGRGTGLARVPAPKYFCYENTSVHADPAGCTLSWQKQRCDLPTEGTDARRRNVSPEPQSISFREVEKLQVMTHQQVWLMNGNKVSITPNYFDVVIFSSGAKPLVFNFSDEETADRVAKATTEAVELCGGRAAIVRTTTDAGTVRRH